MTTAHPPLRCPLEKTYSAFNERTIDTAQAAMSGAGPAPLMRDLNRMQQIVSGLGAVLRIVGGNTVLEDEHDPSRPGSVPPLSKTTEYALTAMAAAICEQLAEDIEARADEYNGEVKS